MKNDYNNLFDHLQQLKHDVIANVKIDNFNRDGEHATVSFRHVLWPHAEINCVVNESFTSQLKQLVHSFNHAPHTYFAKNVGELTNSTERREALAALTSYCMKPKVELDKQSNEIAVLALRVAILAGEYQSVITAVEADTAKGLYNALIAEEGTISLNIINANFNKFVRRIYGEATACPDAATIYDHVLELPISSAQDCHSETLRNWLISHNYQLAYNYDI